MLEISSKEITKIVANLFIEANCHLQEEVFRAWMKALKEEDDPQAKEIISVMIKNAYLAWEEGMPLCQDTGQAVVFVCQGEEVRITGKPIDEAINEGIEKGGREGYLRKSVTRDPLWREHEGSFGPAVIHRKIIPGETLRIDLLPVGCGCEQMGGVEMFPPGDEEKTIREFVLDRVKKAGSKPCPPNIIGLGIGGDLEQSAYLARMALLRPINTCPRLRSGKRNKELGHLERTLLEEINELNIGPQGLGGKTTVLAVNIEASSCHRANLPVAIAFNCHLGRGKSFVWGEDREKLVLDSDRGEGNFKKELKETAEKVATFKDAVTVKLPLSEEVLSTLKAGDRVFLNGVVYTARDAAHKRLVKLIRESKDLPFELEGAVIYYVGPTPPKPGQIIGSAGPTTSARMDTYTPLLLSCGLRGMIGKGDRSPEVIKAIKKYKAVYFITFGGAGAFLSRQITKSEVVAFDDLGTEAIRRLELKDFPAIVGCDAEGRSVYQEG